MPAPHTPKFEDDTTFYCRAGDRQIRRTVIEEQPIDPIARAQHVAEIHGEVIASAGPEAVTLLALREILRHLPADRAVCDAIDRLVSVE